MPYVGLEHIEPHTMRLLGQEDPRHIRSSSLRFSEGDVLYARMRPYMNKVWVAEFDGLCSAEFLVFPQIEALNSQFLAYRLNAEDFVAFAELQVSGERPRVDFDRLSSFTILLPPLAEQHRIVSKLNSSLSRIDRAVSATLKAQAKLQDYRTVLLEAAVTGELTLEWREKEQEGGKDHSRYANELVQRLTAGRRAHWEHVELARLRKKNSKLKSEAWKSRYPEPTPPDTKGLPNLPESWRWASLDMIAEITSGIAVSQNRIIADPVTLPYLRVANVRRGHLDLTELKKIRVEKDKVENYLLTKGDILFTEGGDRDKLGRGWIWEEQIPNCVHQNHIFRARLFDQALDPRIVSHWANTFGREFFLKHGTQTTNLASINRRVLRKLAVPIPPPAEQSTILDELESRLATSARLATTLDRELERARMVRQSLFVNAFAGRLVPQDPNDERVSLEGIRREKSRRAIEGKKTRRRAGAKKIRREPSMLKQPDIPECLNAAWEKIGRKANARRLFDATGLGPEHVVPFYEALWGAWEIRAAFERSHREVVQRRDRIAQSDHEDEKLRGRFRLLEIWLEDFKNLKNYLVRFEPTHGTDVVLGWNGTGKSNLFEALVIIFRDLHDWSEKNRWPEKPLNGFRLKYELGDQTVAITWRPGGMKRPEARGAAVDRNQKNEGESYRIKREELPLPRFVFGYYSGPTNRLAEHFFPMNQAHYDRLRRAKSDDAKTLTKLLEQRRFFCAETHHAKYVLLAFSYKEDKEIREFLENRLRIVGFESALFVIRRPPWAKAGSKAEEFWGATGIMRRVMERLSRYAIAPMVLRQTVSDGYRSVREDFYYFFLPDLASLNAFAAEYPDARTFFLALESTDFSELIHDVKIQVRVKATNTEEVAITFHQLSEGEQQLLMVLGLMRFTKSHQSLVLLDEPDTHLNPHWSVHYLRDLSRVMSDNSSESSEQQSSQTLMATHDPLVIASLVKEQIHLLKRDPKTGACKWAPATINPRGLGFTGILTSEMFGFRSDLDAETLADLDNRVRLIAREGSLSVQEQRELEGIDRRLTEAGFTKAFSDPYYAAFLRAWSRRYSELMANEEIVSQEKQQEIDQISREVLKEAVAEVERKLAG